MSNEEIEKLAEKAYPDLTLSTNKPDQQHNFYQWHRRQGFVKGYKDALSAQPCRWVSVKDNPPEHDKWMLLFNGNWIGVGKYDKCEDEEFPTPEWQDETHEYIHPIPTHWASLPEPPK